MTSSQPIKRRKRQIPGRVPGEQRRLMLYVYEDELELLRHAAARIGLSVSGYVSLAAIEKAKLDTKPPNPRR